MTVLRLGERRIFFRSRAFRETAAALRYLLLRRDAPDVAHLAFHPETAAVGPVQRDEAMLLHALVRMVRPRTVVEIGFLAGDSAFNFLRALDSDAMLYSFDIDAGCAAIAAERFGNDRRFVFRRRSQDSLTPEDIDGSLADLVFLDAAHDLKLNQETFSRLQLLMAPRAIVAIHDTGTVPRKFTAEDDERRRLAERWVGDEYEPQPEERAFVNWLLEQHPEYAQIHLHSRRTPRHGLTLLQRSAPLPRPPGAPV